MQQTEIHPFKWFVPKNSRILIIGTFPPTRRNWSYEFFYPNKQNLFWTVMSKVANLELKHFAGKDAIEERKHILEVLQVAITDMGHTITRNNNSSHDENIVAINYMDIFQILAENTTISKLVFTSSSGPNSAANWFSGYLKSKNILHKFPKGLKPVKSEFLFRDRLIQLAILYSPSRRAANRISIDNLINMYKNEIFLS